MPDHQTSPVGEDAGLPAPVAHASKGEQAFFVKWTELGKPLRGAGIALYTAEQVRQAQHDAVANRDAEIAALRAQLACNLSGAAPTQPKAQGSIDTPEFRALLADFGHNWTNGDEAQKASRAALIDHIDAWAGSRAGDAAPDGWRLTPEQPTNKMTAIGQDLRYKSVNSIGAIYRAMLAAAPAPGKPAGNDQDNSA
jgi:hypothetical protein